MQPVITRDVKLRKTQYTPHGLARDYAERKMSDMAKPTPKAAANRLREARARLGMTIEQMAERSGFSGAQISRWEKGGNGIPSQRLPILAEAYSIKLDEIFVTDEITKELTLHRSNALPFRFQPGSSASTVRDVPVFRSSLLAPALFDGIEVERLMLDGGEVIGQLLRPTILNGQQHVYGLYVQGASMSPRFGDGETVIAQDSNWGRPARVGDDVIVYLKGQTDGGDAVLLKRLVKKSADAMELQQFAPNVTFSVPMSSVERVDRVIPFSELLA